MTRTRTVAFTLGPLMQVVVTGAPLPPPVFAALLADPGNHPHLAANPHLTGEQFQLLATSARSAAVRTQLVEHPAAVDHVQFLLEGERRRTVWTAAARRWGSSVIDLLLETHGRSRGEDRRFFADLAVRTMSDDPRVLTLVGEASSGPIADYVLVWSRHAGADAGEVASLVASSMHRGGWNSCAGEVEALIVLCASRPDVAASFARHSDPRLVVAAVHVPLGPEALDAALATLATTQLPGLWPWSPAASSALATLCHGAWVDDERRRAAATIAAAQPAPPAPPSSPPHLRHTTMATALTKEDRSALVANVARVRASSPLRPSAHWAVVAAMFTHGAAAVAGDAGQAARLVDRLVTLSLPLRRALMGALAHGRPVGPLAVVPLSNLPGLRPSNYPAELQASVRDTASCHPAPPDIPLSRLVDVSLTLSVGPWWDPQAPGGRLWGQLQRDWQVGRIVAATAVARELGDDVERWRVAAAVIETLDRATPVAELAAIVDTLGA